MGIRWGCIEGSGGFPDPFAAALIDRRLKSRLAARRCFCRSRVLGQMPAPGSWISFLPLSVNGLDPADVAGSGSHVGVVESRVNPARVVGVAGPDGGVDILAGKGPLGFDSPRICVQVKSGHQVSGVNVLRELQGVMQTFKADHGPLVSWGGFARPAEQEARAMHFNIRLWGSVHCWRRCRNTTSFFRRT